VRTPGGSRMNVVERAGQELVSESQTGHRVTKKRLVDSLNCTNFMEEPIIVHLEHARYGTPLFLRAYPQPCSGEVLHCLWAEPCPANVATSYTARNFMIDKGLDLLIVDPQSSEMNGTGIRFVLPEECRGLRLRRAKRYASEGIQVTLMQHSATFSGILDDFTAFSFRVLVSIQPPQTFEWIDENAPLYAVISDAQTHTILYTGECTIIRQSESKKERSLVLEPLNRDETESRRERLSGNGYVLSPQPNVTFNHPLAKKRISLEVDEISSRWFSVVEQYESAALFTGLVIPQVELELVPGLSLACRVQVGSGDAREDDGQQTVKWRIVIVDMSVEDQGKLFALLQKVQHQTSHAGGRVDLNDLLTFFFDAGFVYPKKYTTLYMYKERFRETYRKLYLDNPTIARHFIQLDKGGIQAHLSMIRFYENTWMLHHHAAVGQNGGGLKVLNQVKDYINDYRSYYSTHMDYLMCYFRPNNRFPNRVFGGFAKALSNPKHCSIDSFAYLNFSFEKVCKEEEKDNGWILENASADDLAELSNFYDHISGGLVIKALDLGADAHKSNTLNEEYEKLGFKREKYIFALKKDGWLKAIVLAVVSDTGLNLSNLTNCVHVFVMDAEDLPVEVLYEHVGTLFPYYSEDEIPVLLYPLSYVEDQSIPYEKVYNLWAFDCKHASRYYEYMGRIISGRRGIETGERVIQEVVRP